MFRKLKLYEFESQLFHLFCFKPLPTAASGLAEDNFGIAMRSRSLDPSQVSFLRGPFLS